MKQIVLFLRLPLVFSRLIFALTKQYFFLKKELKPILDEALHSNDGSLNKKDFNKITKYYGLAVPAILGEAFCKLNGIEFTELERKTTTYQGALTGLFDDFFDDGYYNDEEIWKRLTELKTCGVETSADILFFKFFARN